MIQGAIPTSTFEFVRDRISEILKTELVDKGITMNVWLERAMSFDISELPCINISYTGGDLLATNGQDSQYRHTYTVDVYTLGNTTINTDATILTRGDKNSALSLHRTLAVIRSILTHQNYRTLNLPNNIVQKVKLPKLLIKDSDAKDSENVMQGRVIIDVDAYETTNKEVGVLLDNNETAIKLEQTTKGYLLKLK